MQSDAFLFWLKTMPSISRYCSVAVLIITIGVVIGRRRKKKPFWKVFIVGILLSLGIQVAMSLIIILFVVPELYSISGR